MRFLLLTGLSGAGKTSATRYLEDMGAFCVDNLPPMMMLKFMEACQTSAMHCPLVALAVDVRSGEFFDAKAVSRRTDVSAQAVIIITAVDIFFTDAQHINVRTI